jgi:Skp family chaperone for outer membrane proteins
MLGPTKRNTTFEMKKFLTLITIATGLTLTFNTAQAQGVAIVDLDAVAQELGVLDYIRITLENSEFDKRAALTQTQKTLQAEMDKAIVAAGANPKEKLELDKLTPEQRQNVAITNRDLETKFQQTRVKAAQEIEIEKLQMIDAFRQELKPHALAIAKSKNMSVVLNKVMPPVYAFEDSVDITKELTALAKQKGLAKKAPARKAPQP